MEIKALKWLIFSVKDTLLVLRVRQGGTWRWHADGAHAALGQEHAGGRETLSRVAGDGTGELLPTALALVAQESW